jgi:hypothetical protein
MAFSPLKLLMVTDNTRRFCGRVSPALQADLVHRAFEVEAYTLGDLPADLNVESYDGLVLGFPVFGSGRDGAPSQAILDFVNSLGDLDEIRVALFCVYQVWEGPSLLRFQSILEGLGAEVHCSQAFWILRPKHRKHELPAEIMVRIR